MNNPVLYYTCTMFANLLVVNTRKNLQFATIDTRNIIKTVLQYHFHQSQALHRYMYVNVTFQIHALTAYKTGPILDPISRTVFPLKSGRRSQKMNFSCSRDIEWDMKSAARQQNIKDTKVCYELYVSAMSCVLQIWAVKYHIILPN